MKNNYFLYRHIRLDRNEPFYVGIGTKKQWYTDHKTEYRRAYERTNRTKYWKNIINKSDFDVEILAESSDYDFIKEREIEFIKLYGRRDLKEGTLCNLTNGGEGSHGWVISEETRLNMIKGRRNQIRKGLKVYQYDVDGNFVKEWRSMSTAEKELKIPQTSISKYLKGLRILVGNSHWSNIKRESYIGDKKRSNKKIYQYDKNGFFIKEWNSISEASKYFNVCNSTIDNGLIHRTNFPCGFYWDYEKKEKIEICNKSRKFKNINQFTLDNKLIKTYESMREVHELCFSNIKFKSVKRSIQMSLYKERPSAYGYRWVYVNDCPLDVIKNN